MIKWKVVLTSRREEKHDCLKMVEKKRNGNTNVVQKKPEKFTGSEKTFHLENGKIMQIGFSEILVRKGNSQVFSVFRFSYEISKRL